jgi:predicted dehydrogenase
VYLVRQSEQHFGPHSDWFWDPELAGGGVLMDMGCHGIEFTRWVHRKPPVRSVSAEVGNSGFTQEMDHFARCAAEDAVPSETGEDGRAVLEIIYAAYRAARCGRVEFPLQLTDEEAPRPPFAQLVASETG